MSDNNSNNILTPGSKFSMKVVDTGKLMKKSVDNQNSMLQSLNRLSNKKINKTIVNKAILYFLFQVY